MAIYNEILVARFARGIQKLFGIKGTVPTKQLSGELMAVFPVFNGRENRALEGWKTFRASFSVGPTAAQTEGIQIRNPAGSNVLAVIESIQLFFPGGTGPFLALITTNFAASQSDLTNAATGVSTDQRQGGITGSTLVLSTSAGGTVNLAVTLAIMGTLQNVFNELIGYQEQEIPLLPSSTIRIVENTVNQQMLINVCWRERLLEEAERSL